MSEKKQHKKRIRASEALPEALSGDWVHALLRRHYGIALFVCGLFMIGMVQNFQYQRILLNEAEIQQKVEQEQRRALVFSASRESATRPTHIIEQAKKLGLQMSANPPKKVKLRDENTSPEI